jgi:hypothetical protein
MERQSSSQHRMPLVAMIGVVVPLLVGLASAQAQPQIAAGDILVLDTHCCSSGLGAVLKVNPTTGARTVIFAFDSCLPGTASLTDVRSIVAMEGGVDPGGPELLASTLSGLYRLDLSTGKCSLFSSGRVDFVTVVP